MKNVLPVACDMKDVPVVPQLTGTSLLSRQGYFVLPNYLIIYIILQTLVGYNTACDVQEPFSDWAVNFYFAAGFSFVTATFQYVNKIITCWKLNDLPRSYDTVMHYLAALTITFITGSAMFLSYARNHGGICRDILGVETSAAQWSEWITAVPLMGYIAVAVENKVALTRPDWTLTFCLFLTILSGVVLNFKYQSYIFGWFLFIFGSIMLVGSYIAISYIDKNNRNVEQQFNNGASTIKISDDELIAATKRKSLTRLIFILFPSFPVVYLLRYMNVINRDHLYVGFVLLSVLAKLCFVNYLVEAQLDVIGKINLRKHSEGIANETRRAFLRYVFHELRTPLNTLTMGMAVIDDEKGNIQYYPLFCNIDS